MEAKVEEEEEEEVTSFPDTYIQSCSPDPLFSIHFTWQANYCMRAHAKNGVMSCRMMTWASRS